MPAIIRNDESVLTPGQMRAVAGANSGVVINIDNRGVYGEDAISQVTTKAVVSGLRQYDAQLPSRIKQIRSRGQ
jgi:hypothetical protein